MGVEWSLPLLFSQAFRCDKLGGLALASLGIGKGRGVESPAFLLSRFGFYELSGLALVIILGYLGAQLDVGGQVSQFATITQ